MSLSSYSSGAAPGLYHVTECKEERRLIANGECLRTELLEAVGVLKTAFANSIERGQLRIGE